MKRIHKYVIGGAGVVVVAAAAGVAYWWMYEQPPKTRKYVRDPYAYVVPPVAYPMKGKTFFAPEQTEPIAVTLSKVMPSTKRDYPMGTYSVPGDDREYQLYALDDLATDVVAGLRVVPIVTVPAAGTGQFYYLAVVQETGDTFTHVASHLLGDRIRVRNITRDNNLVTVAYSVHAAGQPMAELPSVDTEAIIDIAQGVFVQEGRKPWLESLLAPKEFVGVYEWQKTEGATAAVPSDASLFTMRFDGPRVTLTTDCNRGSSDVTLPRGTSTAMTFGPVAQTKLFCESSEEATYFAMFENVVSYAEENNGATVFLTLRDDSVMTFTRPATTVEYETDTPATQLD